MEKIPYELLIKYCRKETTPDESIQVEQWISEEDNLSLFLSLKKEWHFINESSFVFPNKELTWKRIKNKTVSSDKSRLSISRILKITAAACLLVALTLSITYSLFRFPYVSSSLEQHTIVSTQNSEKSKITLSDGTNILLNSNSVLTFSNDYNINIREVTGEGELYFEVVSSDKKFIVNAGPVKIGVLGTSFNVKMDDVNNKIDISLKEGKVAVYNRKDNTKLFEMSPLQHAVIDKTQLTYEIRQENIFSADTWTFERLSIHDEPLKEFLGKLEERYSIQIELNGLNLDKHYTFDLQEESLPEFLDSFSVITPIKYEISDNKVYIESKSID